MFIRCSSFCLFYSREMQVMSTLNTLPSLLLMFEGDDMWRIIDFSFWLYYRAVCRLSLKDHTLVFAKFWHLQSMCASQFQRLLSNPCDTILHFLIFSVWFLDYFCITLKLAWPVQSITAKKESSHFRRRLHSCGGVIKFEKRTDTGTV